MNFRPELAEKVMAGEKTVTRRLVSDKPHSPWWREKCSLIVGRDYAVCPGRGKEAIGRVRIVSVSRESVGLGTFTRVDFAREEGFDTPEDFRAAWESINGPTPIGTALWRIEFVVDKTALRVVHGWNTQCGGCGYGGTSWADSPALEGKPIITPESESCPECGARFVGNDERHGLVTRYPAERAS